jgi:hypothetical protein
VRSHCLMLFIRRRAGITWSRLTDAQLGGRLKRQMTMPYLAKDVCGMHNVQRKLLFRVEIYLFMALRLPSVLRRQSALDLVYVRLDQAASRLLQPPRWALCMEVKRSRR